MEKKLILYNTFVSVIMLLVVDLLELRTSYSLMLIFSVNIAVVYFSLFVHELRNFKGLNIKIILLIGYLLRLVLPALEKSFNAISGEGSYNITPENVTTDYLFPTIIWMNIYYMIFFWCVIKYSTTVSIENKIKPFFSKFNVTAIVIPVFIIGIAYKIVLSFIPAGLVPGSITMLLGNFCNLAIVAQLFNTLFNYSKKKYLLFVTFIIIALLQSMFFGFYKGPIMYNVLFYLVFVFLNRQYRGLTPITPRFLIMCAAFMAFLFMFVYPFMQTKRSVSGWSPEAGYIAIYDYSNLQIMKDVISGNAKFVKQESGSRFDAIDANAFFYKECCERGLRSTKLLISNVELLVPRFINPNKHNAEAGLMVTSYVFFGNFDQQDKALSSNFVGQFASAYLVGGAFFAIIMAFFNGWFLSRYYTFLVKHSRNILAIVFLISFMLDALLAFEEIHDAGALRTGLYTVQMIGIVILDKFGILSIKK